MTTKRAVDIIIAGSLLLLALPIILISAIGVAISLRAWPFFTQVRIGQHGQQFRFVKLRTLPASTPAYADKYALEEVATPWFPGLLRTLHLDELPQLALVVLGHMSLVGPRPEMPHLHEQMPETFARTRTAVRPGCTGLWQVGADNDRLIHESPEYDLLYVTHASALLDLWILWRTVLVVTGIAAGLALDAMPTWALAEAPAQTTTVHEPAVLPRFATETLAA